MRNHFARTGLPRNTRDEDVRERLERVDTSGDPELAADVKAAWEVLETPAQRTHYRRVHLQYRTIATALDALDAPLATDSHRWRERVVEFEPEDQSGS